MLPLPDLETLISTSLQERINELEPTLQLQPGTLQLTPEKGYSARSVSSLTHQGQPLGTGTLYTLVFAPGNGTGTQEHYALDTIPPQWTPRNKQGAAELFISVGTYHERKWLAGITSLHAAT